MCIRCYAHVRQSILDQIHGLLLLIWGVAMLLQGIVQLCKGYWVKAYRWISRAESVEHDESESEMNDINEDDALAIDCEDLPSLLGEDFALSDG